MEHEILYKGKYYNRKRLMESVNATSSGPAKAGTTNVDNNKTSSGPAKAGAVSHIHVLIRVYNNITTR